MTKLIFIGFPTSGTVENGAIKQDVIKVIADLHTIWPKCTFLVPMIQDYQLLPYMDITPTWENWGHHCEKLISVCDEVWILEYSGVDSSTGVKAEIALALKLKKKVYYVRPNYLDDIYAIHQASVDINSWD
jgi:hypothetical protein